MEEKLEVICGDLQRNPRCPHGPTLLFKKLTKYDNEEYYACSAYRSKKGCGFYMKKSDFLNNKNLNQHRSYFQSINATNLRGQILATNPQQRCYCHSCNILFKKELCFDHVDHDVLIGISDELFKHPTQILQPLSDDKAEAQYFFNKSTLQFLGNCLTEMGIRKVVCMGAPRLHEYLKEQHSWLQIDSFLLDLDHRFFYFYDADEFAWFNMFNTYFFEENPKVEIFEKFLQVNGEESILLFTDPPFGCRTEPLVNTIKEISATYKRVNSFHHIMPVFWIFPYFMELYIKKCMPEMEMIDYKINYTNHDLYHDGPKGRKQGSPVRLYTNTASHLIELPKSEGYKFCEKCNRWTGIENVHCDICKKCPSKNGEAYRHCIFCADCVKPNYVHCNECRRCTQKANHSCQDYQKNLHCWICKQRGHTEYKCNKWKELSRKGKKHRNAFALMSKTVSNLPKICLVCTRFKHNEKDCPRRQSILKETHFMDNVNNIFSNI